MDRSPRLEGENLRQPQPFDGFQSHSNDSRRNVYAELVLICLLNSLYITGLCNLPGGAAKRLPPDPFLGPQTAHISFLSIRRDAPGFRARAHDAILRRSNLLMEFKVIRMTQDAMGTRRYSLYVS